MTSKDIFSITNKNIIISGGNGGIGSRLVKAFISRKAKVISIDKNLIKFKHKNLYSVKFDFLKFNENKKELENYLSKFKKIDVLINCAGVTYPNNSEKYNSDDWNKTMTINATTYFELAQLTVKYMKNLKTSGSIINFTSIGGVLGFPNNPAYSASKGAVQQLTKSLAIDLAKYNIKVNNIVPGYINTPMNHKSWKSKKERNKRSKRTILGRWGKVSDLIGPAVFLSSDASNYITGSDLVVDGGWLSKGF